MNSSNAKLPAHAPGGYVKGKKTTKSQSWSVCGVGLGSTSSFKIDVEESWIESVYSSAPTNSAEDSSKCDEGLVSKGNSATLTGITDVAVQEKSDQVDGESRETTSETGEWEKKLVSPHSAATSERDLHFLHEKKGKGKKKLKTVAGALARYKEENKKLVQVNRVLLTLNKRLGLKVSDLNRQLDCCEKGLSREKKFTQMRNSVVRQHISNGLSAYRSESYRIYAENRILRQTLTKLKADFMALSEKHKKLLAECEKPRQSHIVKKYKKVKSYFVQCKLRNEKLEQALCQEKRKTKILAKKLLCYENYTEAQTQTYSKSTKSQWTSQNEMNKSEDLGGGDAQQFHTSDQVSSEYPAEDEQPKKLTEEDFDPLSPADHTMQKNILKLCAPEALVKLPVKKILKRVAVLRYAFVDLMTENEQLERRYKLLNQLIYHLKQSQTENREKNTILELQQTIKEQKQILESMKARSEDRKKCSYCERYVEIIKQRDKRIEQLSKELSTAKRRNYSLPTKSWFNWWWFSPNKSNRTM